MDAKGKTNWAKGARLVLLVLTGFGIFAIWGCNQNPTSTEPAPIISYTGSSIAAVRNVAIVPDTVLSSGGMVTSYSISPSLPSGLLLDTGTGLIIGTPSVVSASTNYTVTATGPGGKWTTTITIVVQEMSPAIAYASPVSDTVGKPASHGVTSTGGEVTSYSVSPSLPAGLSLDASTGLISGTPYTTTAATNYKIVATGLGGKDTAIISIAVIINTASSNGSTIGVRVSLPHEVVMAKTSVISLRKLIIVLTSSAGDTIRDTITSSTIPALSSSVAASQTVGKYYSVRSLRSWKLVAQTKDLKDSVIHRDSAVTGVLSIGDTTIISLSMSAKYVMYMANFRLPDSLCSSVLGAANKKVYFSRLVWNIDANNVRDSSMTYFPTTDASSLYYDYVTVGNHAVKLYAYGHLIGGADGLLYSDSTSINLGTSDSTVARTLTYVGPGGVNGATGNVSVTIRRVTTITINGTVPPVLLK